VTLAYVTWFFYVLCDIRYTGPRVILSSTRVAFLHTKAEHLATSDLSPWWWPAESNPRPTALEANALPLSHPGGVRQQRHPLSLSLHHANTASVLRFASLCIGRAAGFSIDCLDAHLAWLSNYTLVHWVIAPSISPDHRLLLFWMMFRTTTFWLIKDIYCYDLLHGMARLWLASGNRVYRGRCDPAPPRLMAAATVRSITLDYD
jgi:hypothetical protein